LASNRLGNYDETMNSKKLEIPHGVSTKMLRDTDRTLQKVLFFLHMFKLFEIIKSKRFILACTFLFV